MRGQGLAKRLEDMRLARAELADGENAILEDLKNLEENPVKRRPRSGSKSPSKLAPKAAASASKPYDVPSASGPGGLVSMLKNLRLLREENLKRRKEEEAMDTTTSSSKVDETFVTCREIGSNGDTTIDNLDINANSRYRGGGADNDDDVDATDLEKKIIRQVEHYFGDYNLPKDKWMLEKMRECEDGWFDMETMMTFKRLSGFTRDPRVVLEALAKSRSDLLQIENWGQGKGRVRRNPDYPIPELNEARRISIQDRTLFVWGFDKTSTTLDDLIEYFENNFRNVVNIRQRTKRSREDGADPEKEMIEEEAEPKREFMGSVFVTFRSRQDAEDFFRAPRHKRLIFKGRQLQAKWQKDFYHDKTEFNDEFDASAIEQTVYVSGFDKLDTTKEELMRFFNRFRGSTSLRKRVYRFAGGDSDWQFTGGVFLTFDTRDNAKEFLAIFGDGLKYNGDALKVKWQAEFYREKGIFKREMDSLKKKD